MPMQAVCAVKLGESLNGLARRRPSRHRERGREDEEGPTRDHREGQGPEDAASGPTADGPRRHPSIVTAWATPAPSSVSLPVVQRLEWAKSQQTSDSDLLLVSDGRNKELRGKIEKALGPSGSDTVEEFIVVFEDAARFKGPVQNAPGWMTFFLFLRSKVPLEKLGLQKREDS